MAHPALARHAADRGKVADELAREGWRLVTARDLPKLSPASLERPEVRVAFERTQNERPARLAVRKTGASDEELSAAVALASEMQWGALGVAKVGGETILTFYPLARPLRGRQAHLLKPPAPPPAGRGSVLPEEVLREIVHIYLTDGERSHHRTAKIANDRGLERAQGGSEWRQSSVRSVMRSRAGQRVVEQLAAQRISPGRPPGGQDVDP
jgi:hypothetical protein